MGYISGFNEKYGYELQKKDCLLRILTDLISRKGYEEIQVPILEPKASFSESVVGLSPWPEWNKKGCFYFEISNYKNSYDGECEKEEVLLIPEGTVSVTRWLGDLMNSQEVTFPLKMFYNQKCYRNEVIDYLTETKRREFQQFGIEILGAKSIHSDIEVLIIIFKCLQSVGVPIEDIRVRLNNITIFNLLVKDCNIRAEDAIIIKERLDFIAECKAGKHPEEIKSAIDDTIELLGKYNLVQNDWERWKGIINCDPNVFDDKLYEIFDDKYHLYFNELCELKSEFMENNMKLNIDLCVIRSHEYYTGISYEVDVVSEDRNFIEIAGGGRYDRLVSSFLNSKNSVKQVPCTGFAFGLERVLDMAEYFGFFAQVKEVKSEFFFTKDNVISVIPKRNTVKDYFEAYKHADDMNVPTNIYVG